MGVDGKFLPGAAPASTRPKLSKLQKNGDLAVAGSGAGRDSHRERQGGG